MQPRCVSLVVLWVFIFLSREGVSVGRIIYMEIKEIILYGFECFRPAIFTVSYWKGIPVLCKKIKLCPFPEVLVRACSSPLLPFSTLQNQDG